MDSSALQVPWLLASALALVVALIFVFVVPESAANTRSVWQQWVLRWGHTSVWLLLALSFLLRALEKPKAATPFGLTALALYLLFLITLVRR